MTNRTPIYAMRGIFGCFTIYTTSIKAPDLGPLFNAYFVKAAEDEKLGISAFERAQRHIDMAHVRRIRGYLGKKIRVFGTPVATAEVREIRDLSALTGVPGLVEIEVDKTHLVDGQKRTLSMIRMNQENTSFADDLPVLFVNTTDRYHQQQLFADSNGTAAKVSASLNAIYDVTNPLATFIPQIIPAHLLEVEKASVATKSTKLVTPGIVKEALALLFSTSVKNIESQPIERIQAGWDTWHDYFSVLIASYEKLAADYEGFETLRAISILPHNVTFLALVRLIPIIHRNKMGAKVFEKLESLHLEGFTDRINPIWDGRCLSFGKMKKNTSTVENTAAALAKMLEIDLSNEPGLNMLV